MGEWVLRTGIPGVDALFRVHEPPTEDHTDADAPSASVLTPVDRKDGILLPDLKTGTSLCILGPHGTGKSVLAMHVAVRYLADCFEAAGRKPTTCPRVCYVSTDMTEPVARTMLTTFGLDSPNARHVPFVDHAFARDARRRILTPQWLTPSGGTFLRSLKVELGPCPADDPEHLARYLSSASATGKSGNKVEIAFVDLASRTAGDDWAFVHRLVGVLGDRPDDLPRHLVVIDAIEGLETFAGDLDAFGEAIPRRARIAKLMRLAAGRCHMVLIVEEAAEGVRLPEEFVADAVIRLRSTDSGSYNRRTLQVEKARGQSTVRGRHPYTVRSGRGSTTGEATNYDDPTVRRLGKYQGYVELYPSLHHVTRATMEETKRQQVAPASARAEFGIRHLDDMLAGHTVGSSPGSNKRGLPCSTITALVGDAGTQKTGLGIAFLGRAYAELVRTLVLKYRPGAPVPSAAECERVVARLGREQAGVPVLITTHHENSADLARFFMKQLRKIKGADNLLAEDGQWANALKSYIEKRTICRRLEIHDMPPQVLFNIVKRAVEAAQRTLRNQDPNPLEGGPLPLDSEERFKDSWRIRLVIDDLSTVMDTYAQVKNDPLFLPFLLFFLRQEGTTSLIIDTRSGGPDADTGDGFHTDLCALSDNRIYTWKVNDFYGDSRIAITPVPPIADDRHARVREVKRLARDKGGERGELFVDPVFELYSGLEENRPRRVPLQVRLYAETEGCRQYADYLNAILMRIFRPPRPESGDRPGDVVVGEEVWNYDLMRDVSFLQMDSRLDHTLVFQIDEFWRQGHLGELERKYLQEEVDFGRSGGYPNIRDPYHTYEEKVLARLPSKKKVASEPHGEEKAPAILPPYTKGAYFASPKCDVTHGADRVPFSWDFGFIACRERAWNEAAESDSGLAKFWRWYSWKPEPGVKPPPRQELTWRTFLQHTCTVARVQSAMRNTRVPGFDLAMMGESFSCLVLEIWLSEILLTLKHRDPLLMGLGERGWEGSTGRPSVGLFALLDGPKDLTGFPGWSLELYKTWLLLIEAMDLDTVPDPGFGLGGGLEERPRPGAVATRHWYKTACSLSDAEHAEIGPIRYCRLPGSFSTRGDWFLAIAPDSRSPFLASKVLDLLCSTRGNLRRLKMGVGLPTRRLVRDGAEGRQNYRSAMITTGGGFGTAKTLSYADVIDLGAGRPSDRRWAGAPPLGWLWRSQLRNYHRHAATWQSWLYRVAQGWRRLQQSERTRWTSGFDIYRDLKRGEPVPPEIAELESFKTFPGICKELIEELRLIEDRDAPDLRRSHAVPRRKAPGLTP